MVKPVAVTTPGVAEPGSMQFENDAKLIQQPLMSSVTL
jgi:hypothetical protein